MYMNQVIHLTENTIIIQKVLMFLKIFLSL